MYRLTLLLAAALLALTACSSYDEEAHRAALTEAAGMGELDDEQWEELHSLGQNLCDMDDEAFSYSVAMAADSGDPELMLAVRRVNIEHLCPERLDEHDELESGMEY